MNLTNQEAYIKKNPKTSIKSNTLTYVEFFFLIGRQEKNEKKTHWAREGVVLDKTEHERVALHARRTIYKASGKAP